MTEQVELNWTGDEDDKTTPPSFRMLDRVEYLNLPSDIKKERYMLDGLRMRNFVHPFDGLLEEDLPTYIYGYMDDKPVPAHWHWQDGSAGATPTWIKVRNDLEQRGIPSGLTGDALDDFNRIDNRASGY